MILKLLAGVIGILAVSHFFVMWAWSLRYKDALGASLKSLEVQSYKTVNEVRTELGLSLLTPEQGGNLVLNRTLLEHFYTNKVKQ